MCTSYLCNAQYELPISGEVDSHNIYVKEAYWVKTQTKSSEFKIL